MKKNIFKKIVASLATVATAIAMMTTAPVTTKAAPEDGYYLVGYINGANHGCEGDWQNVGDYKFVNGSLTAKFTQDSYVFVKAKVGDEFKWYMTATYVSDRTDAVLA